MRHSKGRAPGADRKKQLQELAETGHWGDTERQSAREDSQMRGYRNWPDGGTFTEKGTVRASVLNG